ncbi:uncharacterized protein LOC129619001 [Condylostylus longicornis]|uniref:uncharacterized protein LOC129619001 n=1 Tax=Condylostylus longicornis TaxID=2530218 RepID=UPI00244DF40D|nr:uncharacterized protein LOC129619001 [Condylostylus longicornis]
MSSIIDFKVGFTEITNLYLYIHWAMREKLYLIVDGVNINEITNQLFWIFILFCFGFYIFYELFYVFLKSSKIKYYKRKQFARSIWNIAFCSSSAVFLYYYHEYMISPQLVRNTSRLFPTMSDNTIFYVSQSCERFKMYSLFIITFYLHAAMLDLRENDYCEAGSKLLYTLTIFLLICYKFENYFVILNLNQGIFNIMTECLFLLALQTFNRNRLVHQVLLGFRIASWSHVFISLLPFKYLVPTLFAKNFKFTLNLFIWLWYGLSIWNSPVLQYFYHQIYHNSPTDCAGEGSAAKCILLKDSLEFRHFKTLRKSYLEIRLAREKMNAVAEPPQQKENYSAKTFQAIKCIMTLKRKLRRIREGRDSPQDVSSNNSMDE